MPSCEQTENDEPVIKVTALLIVTRSEPTDMWYPNYISFISFIVNLWQPHTDFVLQLFTVMHTWRKQRFMSLKSSINSIKCPL